MRFFSPNAKTVELSVKDRRILSFLDFNARASLSSIAKNVGLSKQSVAYRLNTLRKSGIIRKYYAVINYPLLGCSFFKAYFKLQSLGERDLAEMIQFIKRNERTLWIGEFQGALDLSFSFLAKNSKEFNSFLDSFLDRFNKFVKARNISIVRNLHHFRRGYFWPPDHNPKDVLIKEADEKIELDKTDFRILQILANNARMPTKAIAEQLGLSPNGVKYKIERLIKSKVILCFRVLIDFEKINYLFYKTLLSLQNFSKKRIEEFVGYCKFHPNIVYLLETTGSWDMELEFEVKSIEEYHKTMREINNKFADLIGSSEPLLVFKEHELNYFPFKTKA